MAPIRVAIIGLSARASTSWAARAHLPYLLSPEGKSQYQIVALCNSSVDAAKEAIALYKLEGKVAAYGDPADLAKDANVDLVVCNTRVDVHYDTIKPSIEAGKNVFVEWPLTHDFQKSSELADLAQQKKLRTIIGLQRRFAPVVQRLKALLHDEKTLGKVLSSNVSVYGGTVRRTGVPTGLKYFLERKVGGSPITIGFIHMFDYIQDVLGEVQQYHSQMQLQRPNNTVFDPTTGKDVDTKTSDVPDLLSLHGRLPPSPTVAKDASIAVYFRRGPPFKGQPEFVWTINCEKGEVRLVNINGSGLLGGSDGSEPVLEVYHFDTEKVETIDWNWSPSQQSLPAIARDVAVMYDAFATGNGHVPDFEDARNRHIQINDFFKEYDAKI